MAFDSHALYHGDTMQYTVITNYAISRRLRHAEERQKNLNRSQCPIDNVTLEWLQFNARQPTKYTTTHGVDKHLLNIHVRFSLR